MLSSMQRQVFLPSRHMYPSLQLSMIDTTFQGQEWMQSVQQRCIFWNQRPGKGMTERLNQVCSLLTKMRIKQEKEKSTAKDAPAQEQAIFGTCYDLKDHMDSKIDTNQTGRFPMTSYKGNQYIMVIFGPANNILVETLGSRPLSEIVRAYQVLIDQLKEKCLLSKLHVLENKYSAEFWVSIQVNEMKIQLVP